MLCLICFLSFKSGAYLPDKPILSCIVYHSYIEGLFMTKIFQSMPTSSKMLYCSTISKQYMSTLTLVVSFSNCCIVVSSSFFSDGFSSASGASGLGSLGGSASAGGATGSGLGCGRGGERGRGREGEREIERVCVKLPACSMTH
jgi:hypothetical protein